MSKITTTVITSGFFNPLHSGHLSLIKGARSLGDRLLVIVNTDKQVLLKGSRPFMLEKERLSIVSELKDVDIAILSIDFDGGVSDTLDMIRRSYWCDRLLFAKGGDRKDSSNMPSSELKVCKRNAIEIVYGVGGFDKQNSSSEILKEYYEYVK